MACLLKKCPLENSFQGHEDSGSALEDKVLVPSRLFAEYWPRPAQNQNMRSRMSGRRPVHPPSKRSPFFGIDSLYLRFLFCKILTINVLLKRSRKKSTAKRLGKHWFWCNIRPRPEGKWPENGPEFHSFTHVGPFFRANRAENLPPENSRCAPAPPPIRPFNEL